MPGVLRRPPSGSRAVLINFTASSAFTLAEAVVAMAVAGIMFMSLYTGITAGFFTVRMTRENLRATQIMLEKMEVIRLCNWDQITSNNVIPATFTAPYYTGTSGSDTNGLVYHGTISIQQPSGDLINGKYTNDLRLITLELRWNTGGIARSRQLNTYYSRWGIQNYVIN